ncbi:MAG: stage II sporulation protein P [Defluviitaleaceae bacterium]|nr:stage II sporulation protein P [Defluviitaleaceae bacterium]
MREVQQKAQTRGFYAKNLALGLVISVMLLFVVSFFNDSVFGEMFLYDALPHYAHILALSEEDLPFPVEVELDVVEIARPLVRELPREEVIINVNPSGSSGIIGLGDVEVDFSTNYATVEDAVETFTPPPMVNPANLADLRDPVLLQRAMYIVDPRTIFVPSMFDVDAKLAKDLRVNPANLGGDAPVVLIFHTHTTEMFADSNPNDMFTGIVGVGAYLTRLLNEAGIPTMHYYRRFDMVDGQSHILGAYERQEVYIRRILEENPTIEIIIDLHRDGLPETSPRLVTNINGEPTARLMFVNGLSMRNVNGVAVPIEHLPNLHLPTNLAFSLQMQIALNEAHPTLNRRIYLNAFRFSTHFLPKSLFVEVGDQRSTFREATNAMYPLAEALVGVLR